MRYCWHKLPTQGTGLIHTCWRTLHIYSQTELSVECAYVVHDWVFLVQTRQTGNSESVMRICMANKRRGKARIVGVARFMIQGDTTGDMFCIRTSLVQIGYFLKVMLPKTRFSLAVCSSFCRGYVVYLTGKNNSATVV